VIKRDKKNRFLFAPLQSDIGVALINKFNIDTDKTDSILLYNPSSNTIKYKSSAALHIAKNLDFPIKLMAIFFIIPGFVRNCVYNFIAKNRYTWYGKKDACMIPTPELQAKFIV
jgi:predicted DCC family thiol-disulfide oxidoreductase YuxK